MKHSVGQLRFERRRAQEDAETVKLMRDSGAIPLVGTNTPELCMMIETYNKINGTTNNPYDLRRTPSGSSGGEVTENCVSFYPRLFMKQYFQYKKFRLCSKTGLHRNAFVHVLQTCFPLT